MVRVVPGRVFQVKLAVFLGLEIDDEIVIIDAFDNEGQVVEVGQRFAGNRVSRFNSIHLEYPRFEMH